MSTITEDFTLAEAQQLAAAQRASRYREDRRRHERQAALVRKLRNSVDGHLDRAGKVVEQAGDRRLSDTEFKRFRQDVEMAAVADQAVKLSEQRSNISRIVEPRTYGTKAGESRHSYYHDLGIMALSEYGLDPRIVAASTERLNRHAIEVDHEIRKDSQEGRAAVAQFRESRRTSFESPADIERQVAELRSGATSSTLAGFQAPVWLQSDFVLYYSNYRALASQCGTFTLPEHGVQLNVPSFTSAAAAGVQSLGEGGPVTASTPTGTALTVPIQAVSGIIFASLQLQERAGPDSTFDIFVSSLLKESYDAAVDGLCISAVTGATGLNTISDAGPLTNTLLWDDLSLAKQRSYLGAGVGMQPSHAFVPGGVLGFIDQAVDTTNARPLWLPTFTQQPFAGLAAKGDPSVRSWTGHEINGLAVFANSNLPAIGSNQQILVGRPDTVMLGEGSFNFQAMPEQQSAINLQVMYQAYAYVAVVVRLGSGWSQISGNAYATSSMTAA